MYTLKEMGALKMQDWKMQVWKMQDEAKATTDKFNYTV